MESVERPLAEINAVFALDFTSPLPMTNTIFPIFSENNLPVNTWPYLREFVSTTLGRMNWTPFTLPALKRGVGAAPTGQPRRSTESDAAAPD
ncbi:MAG: hypothetical protein ACYDCQ_13525 [Dehalococcoidia bacterium]